MQNTTMVTSILLVPPGLTLSMTVLQQGAKRYGAPVLCNVGGC